ncbi:MAG: diaminopimelate decarboxylase [Candidatus Delongbacteria bacterium]|nr:diaminopimelate decarboxylase [Candidatus Delongbacteria bacterium]MBN2836615.1 diaminopimelate decarboxylase [Candidatus Delongbacteria bacterium]
MGKKIYSKPFLKKHISGFQNKFGVSYSRSYRDEIDGASISNMTEKYGSPLFVLSEKTIRKKYRDVYNYFARKYPKIQFSWSYKTNYLNAVCSVFHQEGEIAEVVSEFEYQKAKALGVPGNKIIYNGPYKSEESLKVAFTDGAIVNIDNYDEIFKIEEVAKSLNKKVSVGMRLNMDTGVYPQWSRFGFNLDDGTAFNAAKRIYKSEWMKLTGLHAHIGTFMLDPNAYKIEADKMIDFMKKIESEFGIIIDSLDFGGGFPSKNRLKGVYLPPEVSVPPIEDYIDAISDILLNKLAPNEYPMVYMETGRALIDEAGYLISTVDAVKRLPDGTRSYVIDAGINLLYTSTWYNYKVELEKETVGVPEASKLYGPLCMNIDVVAESVNLPPLKRGNRLVLSPMGAYNMTQWMQFISYRPAVVMVMEDGSTELIRRAEKLEDVTNCEVVPEKLKKFNL